MPDLCYVVKEDVRTLDDRTARLYIHCTDQIQPNTRADLNNTSGRVYFWGLLGVYAGSAF